MVMFPSPAGAREDFPPVFIVKPDGATGDKTQESEEAHSMPVPQESVVSQARPSPESSS